VSAARKQKPRRSAGTTGYIQPQLCELVTEPPDGRQWVHEPKLDGYRMQMHVRGGKTIFYSRNGLDWTGRFPEIAKACEALDDCIIDGEVCAVDKDGLPSFAGLTDALTAKKTAGLVYYVFDIMESGGVIIMPETLRERKALLKKVIKILKGSDRKKLAYVDHKSGDGKAMRKAACEMKLEGIVSKRIDAPYKPNDRSGVWVKSKCRLSQELVVGGWKTTGVAFRSLTVGAYQRGKFVHVGTVGTGYNARNLPALMKALKARASATSCFDLSRDPKSLREVHFVKPTLVIEAEIASWTSDGLVRQASFKGMREDKPAKKVVVEAPQPSPKH
jgi:bifunctional non-homologous end joining protein LigD